MLINIGGLWDGPIPIADERQCLPSIYSDIVFSETFASYNSKAYQDYDSISFKCLSPESKFGSHAEFSLRGWNVMSDEEEICSKEQPKRSFLMKKYGFIHEVSTESEGGKNDVRAVDIQMSENTICRHACKALRVRSCAAKDRHSKVNTAKGLRDTRVRLSLSTAVKFYEVQYRLGFDRPSKTLDWLMTKAQSAIDQLPEPSYISNLNCSLCHSVSKGSNSLATDRVISTYSHTSLDA